MATKELWTASAIPTDGDGYPLHHVKKADARRLIQEHGELIRHAEALAEYAAREIGVPLEEVKAGPIGDMLATIRDCSKPPYSKPGGRVSAR